MDKKEFLELWKKDKAKALDLLYAVYLKNAIDDVNELKNMVDTIEKTFNINIKDILNNMITEQKNRKEINLVNVGLSSIILFKHIAKKLGGK